MNIKSILLYFVFALSLTCAQERISDQSKHIFYLHGRIVEIHGKEAFSEQFDKYEFDSIVSRLSIDGYTMHNEVRSTYVDVNHYASYISNQIDSLISIGTKPNNISVVGASKGGIIAANISHLNNNPINYVLLAANNIYQEQHNDWIFHGRVLGIYDTSDNIAGRSYSYWINRKYKTSSFEQLAIDTKQGHGFLYRPLDAWMRPTNNWILNRGN